MSTQVKDSQPNIRQGLNEIPEEFAHMLLKRYPILSERDLLICSLLKVGVETRYVGQFLSLEVDSVKKAKYRLRKKLQMAPIKSWNEFFSDLKG